MTQSFWKTALMSLVVYVAAPSLAQCVAAPPGTAGWVATRAFPATFVDFSHHIRGGISFPTLRRSSLIHPSLRRPSRPTRYASCSCMSVKRKEKHQPRPSCKSKMFVLGLPVQRSHGTAVIHMKVYHTNCIFDSICFEHVKRDRSVRK